MHRPADYTEPWPTVSTQSNPTTHTIHKRASTGKVQAGYFTNWGIYGANFQPTNITPSDLTHIIYAFADVDPTSGNISLTDTYADEQKHFPGDSWDETGNNLYGCLKQLYLLKLANRNLKTLLSIGGWTYSQDGHFSFISDPTLRANFVTSAVFMVENFGLDGIDIDYEYPTSTTEGQDFADLLTSLRTGFTQLATRKGDTVPYQITAAVAAGSANYQYYVVPQMDAALTYWNLMAYDYAGSWLTWADNDANVYGGTRTNVSTDSAIKWYLANGATASKINMGIPLYGRAFEQTTGLGQPYNGVGPGTTEAGIYAYAQLPLAGATVYENYTDITSYSYDNATMELVSYDDPNIVRAKAAYVQTKGLAGSMFWDLSTDKTGTTESLVWNTANVYGVLDQTLNHISYPDSEWTNIADNMGAITTTTTTSTSATSASTTSTSTTSAPATTTSASGTCAGVAAWSSTAVYTGGQTATYGGYLWTAKWWTEGDTPGGAAGVWTEGAAC
ncbi:carbohydrate-binding module family 5 protein [Jaapia argillacea MUCL 33604]|uniref:Carbohydrate-binding module family 5 protein n=1 Tax=Jaapia argillacea MUCL 33604 TaxID=933084 RepID=A0A067PNM3_9AGAM|nr:carbohydrate-binding module family 5 protein [Jaapia argillacea MUCL 33604]